MPRIARTKSESGLYHVMLRRVGRQFLFADDADRSAFVSMLSRILAEENIELLAWCLMDNHVHLVILDHDDNMSHAMQRINCSYALRLNRRSDHVGHVFQDRFLSKPIESEAYLLNVIRYVHNNPLDLKVRAEDYAWSSYGQYAYGSGGIASCSMVLDMLGGPDGFVRLVAEGTGDDEPNILGAPQDASVARKSASEVLGFPIERVGELPKATRDERLRQLGLAGFSVRQIERLTGIGRNTGARALRGT